MKQSNIAYTVHIVILSFIFATTIGYSFADWAPPAGSPPSNNTPPPINVGGETQEKSGNRILGNWLIAKKAQTQSTVAGDSGTTLVTKDYVDGKIGGGMKAFTGHGCAECPYGSSDKFSRAGYRTCLMKQGDGTLHDPSATLAADGYSAIASCWVGRDMTFDFWSY